MKKKLMIGNMIITFLLLVFSIIPVQVFADYTGSNESKRDSQESLLRNNLCTYDNRYATWLQSKNGPNVTPNVGGCQVEGCCDGCTKDLICCWGIHCAIGIIIPGYGWECLRWEWFVKCYCGTAMPTGHPST